MSLLIYRLFISVVVVVVACLFTYLALKAAWTKPVNPLRWIKTRAEAFVQVDEPSVSEQLDDIGSDVGKILAHFNLDEPKKQQIKNYVEKTEKLQGEELKEKYELGYALLYADGTEFTWYIPRKMKRKLNWSSTEIVSVSEEHIFVRIPSINMAAQGIRIDNPVIGVKRKVGEKLPSVFGSITLVVECLEVNDATTIMVVGLTEHYKRKKDKGQQVN